MSKRSTSIQHVVLDFDGTCTQVPVVAETYLEQYRLRFVENVAPLSDLEWRGVQGIVRRNSPKAAWMLGGCPAAPAAADPYILADESAKLFLRLRGQVHVDLPSSLNSLAYSAAEAVWRDESLPVFRELARRGVRIHFVSNSSSASIRRRVAELIGDDAKLGDAMSVQSDAGKFRICELRWDRTEPLSESAVKRFEELPAVEAIGSSNTPGRPIYLRRGSYFEAIYAALDRDLELLQRTLFVGDIWEMDLAMPAALGARVHLIERKAPYATYDYEYHALAAYGAQGKRSTDLSGLLHWL